MADRINYNVARSLIPGVRAAAASKGIEVSQWLTETIEKELEREKTQQQKLRCFHA